ncbi:MAG TPA: hypothetical protein VMT93_01890 [Gemmatimonadaceae bacterium]|nr:hypothetical protein [Gemmatimonadaceae bacterium]
MSPRAARAGLGGRILLWAAIAGIAYFAVQGGEYSTTALLAQWRAKGREVRAIDSLRHAVDSLAKYKQAVLTDPALQERIAREEFGMIKGKEILYRFAAPADTGARGKRP